MVQGLWPHGPACVPQLHHGGYISPDLFSSAFLQLPTVRRTLNFTAYIAVQLHENGRMPFDVSLVFCLFEIRYFKKKTTGN